MPSYTRSSAAAVKAARELLRRRPEEWTIIRTIVVPGPHGPVETGETVTRRSVDGKLVETTYTGFAEDNPI